RRYSRALPRVNSLSMSSAKRAGMPEEAERRLPAELRLVHMGCPLLSTSWIVTRKKSRDDRSKGEADQYRLHHGLGVEIHAPEPEIARQRGGCDDVVLRERRKRRGEPCCCGSTHGIPRTAPNANLSCNYSSTRLLNESGDGRFLRDAAGLPARTYLFVSCR